MAKHYIVRQLEAWLNNNVMEMMNIVMDGGSGDE